MKKFKIWLRATFQYSRLWRVIYPDGKRTRLLYYYEAKNLKKIFGGKLIIDYTVKNK